MAGEMADLAKALDKLDVNPAPAASSSSQKQPHEEETTMKVTSKPSEKPEAEETSPPAAQKETSSPPEQEQTKQSSKASEEASTSEAQKEEAAPKATGGDSVTSRGAESNVYSSDISGFTASGVTSRQGLQKEGSASHRHRRVMMIFLNSPQPLRERQNPPQPGNWSQVSGR